MPRSKPETEAVKAHLIALHTKHGVFLARGVSLMGVINTEIAKGDSGMGQPDKPFTAGPIPTSVSLVLRSAAIVSATRKNLTELN
jgi:hypothetical protein